MGMPSCQRPATPDRAVSPVVGFAILLALTIAIAGGVVFVGGEALSQLEHSMRSNQAANEMTQFDSQAAVVALGRSKSQQVPLSGTGEISVESDAGRIQIIKADETGQTVVLNETYGAVVQETEETTIAYQGGGVWRKRGNGTSMISPPEFHYRGQTLTFPVIRVVGANDTAVETGPLTVTETGSHKLFNTHRLTDGHIQVTITSEYHRGWAAYFESRTEGGVTHYPANQTVSVNLTVPFTETFDHGVGATADPPAINATGVSQMPGEAGVEGPSVSPMVDKQISDCQTGNCTDLSTAAADGSLENGTYYENGDINLSNTNYDTNSGDIDIVVNGDMTFGGSAGGPGSAAHVINGPNQVTFYVKGGMKISGNTGVNSGGDPSDLLVLVHSDADEIVAASGTPQFTGLIYAPNTDFVLNGGGACGAGGGNGDDDDDDGNPGNGNANAGAPGPGCEGNIVGAMVVNEAKANGAGLVKHVPPTVELQLDAPTEITYIHATENRLNVTAG